ncbi:17953_t:CDS:2 [Cetraspora pellucida]|uniref:17953_t:CDS:1 n=1 Tax=Cetraspora pellucida TaxID=1433469 RepID=A0ACA9M3T0_9GLOM|nr:17953_t:CDS:2 [Cetraspora pellucida]
MSNGIKSSKEPKKQKCNKENKLSAKRKSLTDAQKAEICHLKQKGVSQVKLAEQFSVAEATISNIIREKDRWLSLEPEEALALWLSKVTEVLQTVTEVIIKHKAVQLAEGLESDEPPEPLNIKDAIDFTATAWKKNLIGQLPLDQPMSAHQYIIANNDLIATKIPTDKEIIESALEFIKRISSFLEQQPNGNFKVEDSFIQDLRQLKKKVNFKYIASKQQATLDTFIHSTN